MNAIIQAISYIAEFLHSTIYTWFMEAAHWILSLAVVVLVSTLAWLIPFVWDIVKTIITDLDLSSALMAAWSNLDSDSAAIALFFRVPEAANNLISAVVLRFALKMIPGV